MNELSNNLIIVINILIIYNLLLISQELLSLFIIYLSHVSYHAFNFLIYSYFDVTFFEKLIFHVLFISISIFLYAFITSISFFLLSIETQTFTLINSNFSKKIYPFFSYLFYAIVLFIQLNSLSSLFISKFTFISISQIFKQVKLMVIFFNLLKVFHFKDHSLNKTILI